MMSIFDYVYSGSTRNISKVKNQINLVGAYTNRSPLAVLMERSPYRKRLKNLRRMIELGADPSIKSQMYDAYSGGFVECSILMWAVMNFDYRLAEVVINSGKYDPNEQSDGLSLLQLMITTGRGALWEKIICQIIDDGANVNRLYIDGSSILHKSADRNLYGITKKLINAGANIDLLDKNGKTALGRTRGRVRNNSAIALIEAGADLLEVRDDIEYKISEIPINYLSPYIAWGLFKAKSIDAPEEQTIDYIIAKIAKRPYSIKYIKNPPPEAIAVAILASNGDISKYLK